MRAILNGKLYDTAKAEKLCEFNRTSVYRTKKGALFATYNDLMEGVSIESTDEEEIREVLGKHSVNDYIRVFGEPEQA